MPKLNGHEISEIGVYLALGPTALVGGERLSLKSGLA